LFGCTGYTFAIVEFTRTTVLHTGCTLAIWHRGGFAGYRFTIGIACCSACLQVAILALFTGFARLKAARAIFSLWAW